MGVCFVRRSAHNRRLVRGVRDAAAKSERVCRCGRVVVVASFTGCGLILARHSSLRQHTFPSPDGGGRRNGNGKGGLQRGGGPGDSDGEGGLRGAALSRAVLALVLSLVVCVCVCARVACVRARAGVCVFVVCACVCVCTYV
jgi:hypothetical protein